MTGNGLVIAFTLIYLHQARGIALPVVGLLLAAGAAAGLLAVTVSGVLLDRLGARRVLTGIILGQASAQVLLAWAHNAATALPALLLYGATWAPMFPAIATVIAGLTPDPAAQQRVFAINFTAQNAAIGIGTVLGAAVANVHHPGSFQALFLANAVSCLIFAVALTFLPALRTAPARKEPRAGYRDVLARPGLRLVLVASLIVAFTAYPAFDSGLPAYASVEAHVSARVVALSLTVNTALIVLAQLFVRPPRPPRPAKQRACHQRADPRRLLGGVRPRRAAGRGHRANCFRVRLHCAVRARRDRAGTHCEPACQSPDRRHAPRAGRLTRRPLPVPGIHHLPGTCDGPLSLPVQPQSGLACCVPAASAPSPSEPGFAAC